MKFAKSQIILGALVAVVVLSAMGYKALAARVAAPVTVIALPTPTARPVVSD
jgi:hypothetical protein